MNKELTATISASMTALVLVLSYHYYENAETRRLYEQCLALAAKQIDAATKEQKIVNTVTCYGR